MDDPDLLQGVWFLIGLAFPELCCCTSPYLAILGHGSTKKSLTGYFLSWLL